MRTDYLLLAALWAGYCFVHSALISIAVTEFFKRALGNGYRFYRLVFNIFSIIALAALVLYSQSSRFQGELIFAWSGNWQIPRYCLIAAAVILVIAGARHYRMSQFLGIRQIFDSKMNRTISGSNNIEMTGVLSMMRHPWYTAVFILLWTGDQNRAAITISLVLSVYLVMGTLLEERKLVLEFGDKYRQYQKQVSMFIPLKWLHRKGNRKAS
jgi:methanethiol S-methyltransferase